MSYCSYNRLFFILIYSLIYIFALTTHNIRTDHIPYPIGTTITTTNPYK